jgi:hypothetical protein
LHTKSFTTENNLPPINVLFETEISQNFQTCCKDPTRFLEDLASTILISMATSVNNITDRSQSSYATENFAVCESKDQGAICLPLNKRRLMGRAKKKIPCINISIYPNE